MFTVTLRDLSTSTLFFLNLPSSPHLKEKNRTAVPELQIRQGEVVVFAFAVPVVWWSQITAMRRRVRLGIHLNSENGENILFHSCWDTCPVEGSNVSFVKPFNKKSRNDEFFCRKLLASWPNLRRRMASCSYCWVKRVKRNTHYDLPQKRWVVLVGTPTQVTSFCSELYDLVQQDRKQNRSCVWTELKHHVHIWIYIWIGVRPG